jgi:hypothetical protein
MTLAMFGLVVFSLVVMASLNYNFTQLFLGDEATAGFDVVVHTNEHNRVDTSAEVRADATRARQHRGCGQARRRARRGPTGRRGSQRSLAPGHRCG